MKIKAFESKVLEEGLHIRRSARSGYLLSLPICLSSTFPASKSCFKASGGADTWLWKLLVARKDMTDRARLIVADLSRFLKGKISE
jgi:hypothetical protein